MSIRYFLPHIQRATIQQAELCDGCRIAAKCPGRFVYPPTLGTGMVTDVSSNGIFPGLNPGFKILKFSQIHSSAETLLLAELFDSGNVLGRVAWNTGVAQGKPQECVVNVPDDQLVVTGASSTYLAKPIHANKWNYLMCDGSVQRLHPKETLRGTAATDGIWNGPGNTQCNLTRRPGFPITCGRFERTIDPFNLGGDALCTNEVVPSICGCCRSDAAVHFHSTSWYGADRSRFVRAHPYLG